MIKRIALLAVGFVLGCTQRPMDSRPNESPVSESIAKSSPMTTAEHNDPDWSLSDDDLIKSYINPFKSSAFDSSFAGDVRRSFTEPAKEGLRRMNLAILILAQRQSPTLNSQKLLEDYDQAILSGCTRELKGCVNFKFFAQDSQSAKVVELLARRQTDTTEYYRRLLVAWALRNRILDNGLTDLYMVRANKLDLTSNDPLSVQLKHILISVIQMLPGGAACQSGTPAWLNQLDPWSLSRQKENSLGAASGDLLALAASCMYENHGTMLTPSLLSFVTKAQAPKDSFAQRQDQLFQTSSQMTKNLNLKPIDWKNEYFYMIDRVYTGDLNPTDAMIVWKASHRDAKTLSEMAKLYVQIEMAELIQQSAAYMHPYFNDPTKVTDTMLEEAINQSQPVATQWQQFIHRVDILAQFTDIALQAVASDQQEPTRDFFRGIRRNIKYTVVYPHMMMLAYYMGKRDFQHTYHVWFFNVTIDSSVVINKFFQGYWTPWFNYTGNVDEMGLSADELLYAFQFALETDTFKTFGVDVNDFFNVVMDKLLGAKTVTLRNSIDHLQTQYEGAGEWDDIVHICHNLRKGKAYDNRFSLEEVPFSIFMGNRFRKINADGNGTSSHMQIINGESKTVAEPGYFPYSPTLIDQLERIRSEIQPAISYLGWMRDFYRDYLLKSGTSEAEAAQLMAPIQKRFNEIENLKAQFLSQFYQRDRQVMDCFWPILNHERDLQMQVIKDEAAYLRQVHRDMAALKAHPELTEKMNAKYAFKNLPDGFTGFNHFDANSLVYHQLDFLLRARAFVSTGYDAGELHLPAIDPNTQIQVPENLSELQIYKDDEKVSIAYLDDEQSFINTGLKAMFQPGTTSPDLFWLESFTVNSTSWGNWLNGLVTLYRLGPQIINGTTYQLTADELVQIPLQIVNYINVRDDERQIFAQIGKSGRIEPFFVGSALLYDDQQRVVGIFDNIHDLAYSDYLGTFAGYAKAKAASDAPVASVPSELIPIEKQAQDFYSTITTRAGFVFPLVSDSDQTLKNYYSTLLKKDEQRVIDFEKAIDARFTEDQKSGQIHPIQPDLNREAFTPVYLTPVRERSFAGHVLQFNNDTGNMFNQ